MKRTELISKIQALLRLGRHSSAQPGESANALAAAQRLMREHQIVVDVDTEFVAERTEIGLRVSLARHLAMALVKGRCGVEMVIAIPEVVIMGRVSEVTFAGYAIEFLRGSCARAVAGFAAAEQQRRRRLTPRKRSDFIQGWFQGVMRNWPETTPSGVEAHALALQHDERLAAFKASLFPKLGTRSMPGPKMRESGAAQAGYVAGRQTHVRIAVDGSRAEQLCLEG